MSKETLKTLQAQLEVEKWEKGVATSSDPCGSYEYCVKCEKSNEYPCATAKTAYEAAAKKPAAKKAPAKKKAVPAPAEKATPVTEVKVAPVTEVKVAVKKVPAKKKSK